MLAPSGATALLCRGVVSLLPVSYDLAARDQCKGDEGNRQYGALWRPRGEGNYQARARGGMADTVDSKSIGREAVRVQVPPRPQQQQQHPAGLEVRATHKLGDLAR